ncbi:MAG TPA: carboxypeptidase-like regulatory domain-containing protein [bacterium]
MRCHRVPYRTIARPRTAAGALVAGAAGLLLVSGCAAPGQTELSFNGKARTPQGQGVSAFTLTVGRQAGDAAAVKVTTAQGAYTANISVRGFSPSGGLLGAQSDPVTIRVSADGYQTKTFNVTADQLFVGKPNTLNVTLEPSA